MTSHQNRAHHIGSLLRPISLLKVREAFENGTATQEDLTRAEDEAIRWAIGIQKEAGHKILTDGEYRRAFFWDGFHDNLEGMRAAKDYPFTEMWDFYPPTTALMAAGLKTNPWTLWLCDGKIRRTKSLYRPQFEALARLVSPEDLPNLKITMTNPELYHTPFKQPYDPKVYESDEAYLHDIALAYQAEIADLYEAGCRNIQIDDPMLTFFCDEGMQKGMKKAGLDAEATLSLYVKILNECVQNAPKDLAIGIHLCRGNYQGTHFAKGGYETISKLLFNDVNANTYFLEYDWEGAGTFEPLKDLPKGKTVVLGLISSKLTSFENPEDLKKRVYEAVETLSQSKAGHSKTEALNSLAISPQCGFSTAITGPGHSDIENMEKKLKLVADVARSIWG